MDLHCNGVINFLTDNTDEDHSAMILTDHTFKKDDAPLRFVYDVMVKVYVIISIQIENILAISAKDSLLKLKHAMNVFW